MAKREAWVHLRGRDVPLLPRRATTDFVRWYREAFPVAHFLIVHRTPAQVVQRPDGTRGFGVFSWPSRDPKGYDAAIWIYLALGDLDSEQAVETVAHELAHYEQWRAGKAPSEPWAERRASRLTRLYRRAVRSEGK